MELRRLREFAGLSGRDLAPLIGLSQVSVSRIERGLKVPTLDEVNAWADAVHASDKTRENLVQLAEAAHTEVVTWRAALRERSHLQDQIHELEARTKSLRNFQPLIVPGLLQTAEYARNIFPLVDRTGRQDYAAAVAARLQRQQILYTPDRTFEFLITETALRWSPSPDRSIMIPQLDRISQIATLRNVRVGIIPNGPVTALALHPFIIYEGREESDSFVQVEMVHGATGIHAPEDVSVYRTLMEKLRLDAIFDRDARNLLIRITRDLQETS